MPNAQPSTSKEKKKNIYERVPTPDRQQKKHPSKIYNLKKYTQNLFLFFPKNHHTTTLLNSDTLLYSEISKVSSQNLDAFVYTLYQKDSWWLNMREDPYYRENVYFVKKEKFFFLKALTFSNYFRENQVDIPEDFKKSQSMFRLATETLFSKAISIASRDGKKDFFLTNFAVALGRMNSFLEGTYLSKLNLNKNWQTLLYFWSRTLIYGNRLKILRFYKRSCLDSKITNKKIMSTVTKAQDLLYEPHFVDHRTLWERLLKTNIKRLNPIFKHQILAVPKKMRKNSRGKSGRYRMVWKYVPPYRRDVLVLRWFMQDLWHNEGRNLLDRFTESLIRLVDRPRQTFMFENYRYIHNKVYFKFRLSLFKHYRTLKDVK